MQISTSSRTVPIPQFDTNFNSSDSSSTTTTSPNSTPGNTSSSNSSTAPNSPINSHDQENPPVVQARSGHNVTSREKRNSLTALINTSAPVPSSNRHSAEILSVPELEQVGPSNPKPTPVPKHESRGHHRSKSGHHNPQQSHIQAYVAMYPYHPLKPDELELKKGSEFWKNCIK